MTENQNRELEDTLEKLEASSRNLRLAFRVWLDINWILIKILNIWIFSGKRKTTTFSYSISTWNTRK